MKFNEQKIEDNQPVKCDICGWMGTLRGMMHFDNHGVESQKNIYGVPNGNYCVLCIGHRELQMKAMGIYTGNIIDEIPWSQFKLRGKHETAQH